MTVLPTVLHQYRDSTVMVPGNQVCGITFLAQYNNIIHVHTVSVSAVGVWKFLHCYKDRGTLTQKPGSSWSSSVMPEFVHLMEQQMYKDVHYFMYMYINVHPF